MVIQVHQCPRCELRFLHNAEIQEHFAKDHAADPATFDRYRYQPRSDAEPSDERPHVLVVANQTLGGTNLSRAVLERAGPGTARFTVLVPATHSADQADPPSTAPEEGGGEGTDDVGLALARWRLRTTIDALHQAGVAAEGRVGHADPYRAVLDFVESEPVDEIILSTLPPGSSRWLSVDLPARLQRRLGLPVTTITTGS